MSVVADATLTKPATTSKVSAFFFLLHERVCWPLDACVFSFTRVSGFLPTVARFSFASLSAASPSFPRAEPDAGIGAVWIAPELISGSLFVGSTLVAFGVIGCASAVFAGVAGSVVATGAGFTGVGLLANGGAIV